jgi:hypothetical protein
MDFQARSQLRGCLKDRFIPISTFSRGNILKSSLEAIHNYLGQVGVARLYGHKELHCRHGTFYRRRSCTAQRSRERHGARRDEDSHMTWHARRCACSAGEVRLARTTRPLRPKIIITLVWSIRTNVRRAYEQAAWSGLHLELHILEGGIVTGRSFAVNSYLCYAKLLRLRDA